MDEQTRQFIAAAKNIAVIPSKEPEALAAALALFYSIQESGKHATVLIDAIPEKLQFLIPSVGSLSVPKNFVISIPRATADISQIYYEKTDSHLKIHLTAGSGRMKKEDISLYAQEPAPDLAITVGIADFHKHLQDHLDSSGFVLGTPIVNIDNHAENTKFGQVNIIENRSLAETVADIIQPTGKISKPVADCLLTGLVLHYDHFKSFMVRQEAFQLASDLVKKGAEYHVITEHLSRSTEQELKFFSTILQNLKHSENMAVAAIHSDEFYHFSEQEARQAVGKLRAVGAFGDTLVLWQSHASDSTVKGFFVSQHASTINKFAQHSHSRILNGWVFIALPGTDITGTADTIVRLLS